MTHRGVITPTQVRMCRTDAVTYCQHVVEEVFRPVLYHGVLAWLDDILGYTTDAVNLLEVLERVLAACRSFGLKLHSGKCHFFLHEAKWCGKLVSENGVKHSPSRVEGLIAMPDPENAGQLQQLMCAINWMRQHIPQYATLAAPLLAVVDAAAKRAGGRKTKQLCKIPLVEVGWGREHVDALCEVRNALVAMVPLAHPTRAVCLYCDASQDSWGAICTQVDECDLGKPLREQQHRQLAFLSGEFTVAQLRSPTIEKEAFAIVESAKRLEYLLLRPGGFHLFTDHRNLVYMFNPFATGTVCQTYIHCVATRDGREPRPYGAAIHATKPNEVLHFDYLTLPKDEDSHNKYILVVKDDFSGFVESYPSADPDASTCAASLKEWFYRYEVVEQWVSDQGTHFKNQVVHEPAASVGANHHFTAAYCPWANGIVEVVNRLFLKCIRAVLSDRRLSPSKWERVLGMVQAALNQQPSDKGRAPVTAFKRLPATTPLSTIFSSGTVTEMDEETLRAKVEEHLIATAEALELMHREVTTISDQSRMQARARRAAKSKPPNFTEGDFVLAVSVITLPNKLAIKWQGQKRVAKAVTDWIYKVENLNEPHAKTTHNVSRLRFYAESMCEMTEDLRQHALHSQGGHCVEASCGIRRNAAKKHWEVEVKWLGLDTLEITWEAYSSLQADVPVLLDRYCEAHKEEPQFAEMLQDIPRRSTPQVRRPTQSHRRRRR